MAATKESIEALRDAAKKMQEKADKKKAEAKALERQLKAKTLSEDRKKDTRRKILIGSMLLEKASKYQDANDRLLKDLDKYLVRYDDRTLFKIPEIQAKILIKDENLKESAQE